MSHLTTLQLGLLRDAVAAGDGETILRREYGKKWGDERTAMHGLEMMGHMQFASCHRDVSSKDFVRQSRITETGREALDAAQDESPKEPSV